MAQGNNARRLKFAEVSVQGEVLSVHVLKDPYLYDLRVLVIQCWLPMMVMAFGFFYVASSFRQIGLGAGAGALFTLLYATALMPILRGLRAVAEFTFDRAHDEFRVNGRRLGPLGQITLILQTRLGWSGNRRFRLVIRVKDSPDVVVTETPLLEDGIHQHQYYGETYSERFGSTFKSWEDYRGQRNALDQERDAGMFALTEDIRGFLRSATVATVSN